jgi:hypothetical protein
MNISFFAKKHSLVGHKRRLQRGSSRIRGEQVAAYMGEKYNPTEGYENDLCIYIKPELGTVFAKHSYVDLVDSYDTAKWVVALTDLPMIVTSQLAKEYLEHKFPVVNQIVIIPEHHCNFERARRTRNEVTTVGYIGVIKEFLPYVDEITEKLEKAGLKFIPDYYFRDRQDVVDFYKKIDIQLIWRPRAIRLKNVMKITNAMSFGIPTVSFPEHWFSELDEYYVHALNIDELVASIVKLRDDQELYKSYAEKGILKAEEYHIDNIIKLYRALE